VAAAAEADSAAQPEPPPGPDATTAPEPRTKSDAEAQTPSRISADPTKIEIAIVGAGPAGLAAAIRAARSNVKHVVLERSKLANTIELYQKGKWVMDEPTQLHLHPELGADFQAGTRESVLEEWNRAFEAQDINLKIGPDFALTRLERTGDRFKLHTKGGESFSATHVVLAVGLQGNLRAFGVPGDELPHVTYQLDDPAEHQGKRVVVVGVGDAGIENALALMEHGNDVAIVNRRSEIARAKARNRSLIETAINAGDIAYYTNAEVEHFEPDAVVLKTDEGDVRLGADLVIGRLGAIPPRELLEAMGIEFPSEDKNAVPGVSELYETNVSGLHVIGALAGYPLIKNCMNQGYEVVEHILGHQVTPADEPILREKFVALSGTVSANLLRIQETLPIFAALTTVQLREFLFDSEIRIFAAGETIFERNEFSNSFLCILEGGVEIALPETILDSEATKSEDAPSERRVSLGTGEFFGETSVISGRRRSASATASEPTILIETPQLAMIKLIRSVQAVSDAIDKAFINRVVENLVPNSPKSEREKLVSRGKVLHFRPDEVLFNAGDAPDGLHLIRRGTVTLSLKQDDRERVVDYVQAGNCVGELALLAPDRKRSATVTAKIHTETILIPTEVIAPFLERNQDLRREFERKEAQYAISDVEQFHYERGTVRFLLKETGAHEATDLLLIDESLCIRCNNCEKACADTHSGVSRLDREAGPTYQTSHSSQLHVPTACQHCENPKCMDDCPPDALRRDPDGEVFIMDNCIGCGNCYSNCPYGVIQMAALEPYRPRGVLFDLLFGKLASRRKKTEEGEGGSHSEHAVKCDLCRKLPPRRGGAARAACVASCPTGALVRVNPRKFLDEIIEVENKK
jgi:thioredoxin reductase/Fe-S-cluster-containing dehydrogenase component/CRP-like cAMP-binding protein